MGSSITDYLNQYGTIRYNGYYIKGPRNTVQLEVVPKRDSTGRYVTHSVYRFSVDAWITSDYDYGEYGAGTSTVTNITNLEHAFSQDGGELDISGFGFPDISIGLNSSSARDIEWGPKTQYLKMRHIGPGCVIMQWVVEVAVKRCSGQSLSGVIGRLKEYCYTVRWTIKPNGCTVRTVEGHIEIFAGRLFVSGAISNSIPTTADEYRDLINVITPEGFIRTRPQEYTLSENKQRLSFSVTDEENESDNAYPTGVSAIEMDHRVTSVNFKPDAGSSVLKDCAIVGYVEVAKPYNSRLAWSRAMMIIHERLTHAVNFGGKDKKTIPIVHSISITEHVFKRRVSFAVNYWLTTSTIGDLITATGLFTKLQTTSPRTHAQSMKLAWSQRGAARLQHDETSDVLVDTCVQSGSINIKDKVSLKQFRGSASSILLQCPPKESSYLLWENFIEYDQTNSSIDVQEMPFGATGTTVNTLTRTRQSELPIVENMQGHQFQEIGSGTPTLLVIITGRSYRIGYMPEVPEIVKVLTTRAGKEGSKPVLAYINNRTTIVGKYADCPIYASTWKSIYKIEFKTASELRGFINMGESAMVFSTNSGLNNKYGNQE